MSDNISISLENDNFVIKKMKKKSPFYIHLLLFIATFITTSIAGVQWAGKNYMDLGNIEFGLLYGLLLITFLSAHEFGHYFAARIHKVEATLPYFIPFPPSPLMPNLFGTFGAVIKTRTPILTRKALFDIGVSGPIAGFIVSLIFLIYGLMTLPTIDFIYELHPEYLILFDGKIPETSIHFGDTMIFSLLANIFANPEGYLPPMNEIYHYPFLNVGWFGLFVTSLNMIPIGQLDGGHITYAMFGSRVQKKIAKIFWWSMMTLGVGAVLGVFRDIFLIDYPSEIFNFFKAIFLPLLELINDNAAWVFAGWAGWLFWGLITKVFIKLKHPPIKENDELDNKRKIIGWIALLILFLSFSYNGIYFVG